MLLTVTLNASIDKRYVVDSFEVGHVNRVKECSYYPGGKGLNVSKPAAIIGAEVLATGFTGGHAGAYIEEALEPFNVKADFYHVKDESRSCINIYDESTGKETEFLEPGFTVKPEEFEEFKKHFSGLVEKAEVVAMSGSVPRGLDYHAYQELVKIVKDAGKPVILDTSGELLKHGVDACPTLVKPNKDEIRMLTGLPCDDIDQVIGAAKKLHEKGIEYVAVSLGIDGSLIVCDEGVYRAKVPQNKPVNTVGCGDTMIAGFATSLAEGLSVPDMMARASAMSNAAAMREETGFFVMEDYKKILPQISVEKIE